MVCETYAREGQTRAGALNRLTVQLGKFSRSGKEIKRVGLISLRSLALNLFLRGFRVPRDIVRFAFRRYSLRVALRAPRGVLTYTQLKERVLRLANGLSKLGACQGESIFTLLSDDWEQFEVRLAAFELGAVLTSFHVFHSAEKILAAASQVRPRFFIFDPQVGLDIAQRLVRKFPGLPLLAIGEGKEYELLIRNSVPRRSTNRVRPSDPATLGFTSGTTGESKGLFTTQGVIITSLRMTAANVSVTPGRGEVFLLSIPMVGAGSGAVLPMLLSGATTVIPPAYKVEHLAQMIPAYGVTRTFMTPSLLIDLLDLPDIDLSSLRNLIYGTAPMPAAKLEEAIKRFGPIFQQGYGMAEVLPPVSLLQMQDHIVNGHPAPRNILASAGRVVPGVKVRVVDNEERTLPPGEIGEVLISSPTMFSGYWKRPDLTKQTLRGRWLHTGDFGYFDQEGWLCILDRRVDIIQRGNQIIYPRQIEEAIHCHPAVKEACLVCPGRGAKTFLCVSVRRSWQQGSSPDLGEELRQFLAQRFEPWQVPDQVQFFEELPRSYLAKVIRHEVRNMLKDKGQAYE